MFAQFVGRTSGALHGQSPEERGRHRERTTERRRIHRNHTDELQAKLDLGERAYQFLVNSKGVEWVGQHRHFLVSGEGDKDVRRVPHRFWQQFVVEELHLQFCVRQRLRVATAFKLYIAKDARWTQAAMRDGRRPNSKRRGGAELNAAKAGGLGFALLQYFIDEVQVLRCRSDSSMLLQKARELRQQLLDDGMDAKELPNLKKGAAKMWLKRWRDRHGIRMKTSGMKLKVSWLDMCAKAFRSDAQAQATQYAKTIIPARRPQTGSCNL